MTVWDAPCTDCGADNIAFHTWCSACTDAHKLSARHLRAYHVKRAELFDIARARHGEGMDGHRWHVDHICGPAGDKLFLKDASTGECFASVAMD